MKLPALKFDGQALADWFLRHGEKVAVVVVALGAAGLVWNGIATVVTRSVAAGSTPQAIEKLAREARENIKKAKPPASPRHEAHLAQAIDPWRPERVKIAARSATMPFDRPLFQQLAKRSAPAVFPIEDLQAVVGIAVLPVKPAATDLPAGRIPEPTPEPGRQPVGPRPPRTGPGPRPDATAPPGGAPLPAGEAVKPPPGRITPYVVVTGKIPVARQKAEFTRCFASAGGYDPKRDVPRWDGWRIERTLVVPGGSERWDKLAVKNIPAAVRQQDPAAGPSAETRTFGDEDLPGEFLLTASDAESRFAEPLPARIDEPWGATGLHSWFVPKLQKLRADLKEGAGNQAGPPGEVAPQGLADSPGEYAARTVAVKSVLLHGGAARQPGLPLYRVVVSTRAGKEFRGAAMGSDPALTFAVSNKFGPRLQEALPADEKRPCDLVVRLDMLGKTPVARILAVSFLNEDGSVQEEAVEPDADVVSVTPDGVIQVNAAASAPPRQARVSNLDYRLFRFVDTSVKPGQRYRYRVRLFVRNPNEDLDAEYLDDVSAAKAPLLSSTESNATDAVLVPDPTTVLVRLLKRTDGGPKKPRFEILVLAADRASGNYAIRSLVTDVGGLANVDRKLLNKPGDLRARGEDVATDRIVVDMRGQQEERAEAKPGTKPASGRPPEPQEPPEVLLLRPDGTFEVATAADSALRVERYIGTLPAVEDRRSGSRPPAGQPAGEGGGADPFGGGGATQTPKP